MRISDWSSDVCSSDLIFLVSCHSRESGNPVWGRPTHALGPRFRGDDDKMLRREGFVGPVEPWPERCDIGGVDRRAAPDAKARRRVAIAPDVEGGAFLFPQARGWPCDRMDERRRGTGWGR